MGIPISQIREASPKRGTHRRAVGSTVRITASSVGLQPCPAYTARHHRPGQDFTVGRAPANFGLGEATARSPLPSPPSAQAAPICLQARGKLLLEKPRPQAGEVAVLPPSVGQTIHTSAAHQTHSRVLGGICSPKTALSLNGCPRYPFYPDFDFLMEIHSVNHPAVHPELWRWPWPGGRYAPKSHVWRCPANSLHTTGTGS